MTSEGRDLAGLLARVEAASGPDRELDCYLDTLAHAQKGKTSRFTIVGLPAYDPQRYFFCPNIEIDWIGYDLLNVSPRYTASLDQALALCERVLPGWVVGLDQQASDFWEAVLSKASGRFLIEADGECYGTAKTPALALLAALLRALISQETVNVG